MHNAKESVEMFSELNSKGFEAARQLGEINLRTMERLVCRQMDVMSMLVEGGLRQVKLASESKAYSELVKDQVEFAREVTERVMEEGRENVKIASDTRDEYRAWLEQGMELVSMNISKVQAAAK